MKRDDVMMHYRPSERAFVDRLIDLAERVDQRQSPSLTDFLDPRQVKIAGSIASSFPDVELYISGGYEDAERQRVLFAPSWWTPEGDDWQIAFLRIETPGEYISLSHGDFLGSLVGLGLKRGKLGDISVHEDGCDIVVSRDIADFIRLNLHQVGRAMVHLDEISADRFVVKKSDLQIKEFTVMSLRVDRVASDAFGMSRMKVLDPIKSGKLQLNWQAIDNPATPVEEGDVISLRGHGRVQVLEVGSQSKKGRTFIKVGKYV